MKDGMQYYARLTIFNPLEPTNYSCYQNMNVSEKLQQKNIVNNDLKFVNCLSECFEGQLT
jgi:hypothetical protein